MKRTYLKPEILEMTVVVESMIALSTGGTGQVQGPGEAMDVKQGRNDWDEMWSE